MATQRNPLNQTTGNQADGTPETRTRGDGTSPAMADRTADGTTVTDRTVDRTTVVDRTEYQPSVGQLVADLSNDFSRLARQEIHLARAETMQAVKRATRGAISLAAGGMIAYAGVILLLIAATIALGAVMDSYSLAALIIGAIVLVIGGILIGTGQAALKRANFVPEQTIETLEEDAKWAKEKATR